MDQSPALGGFFLVVIIVGFLAVVIFMAMAITSGLKKADQFDRRRAIERNLRQAASDADTQQRIARKLLRERGE